MPGANSSDSSAAAAGGDQGWPVARARSQPCTWYSQRIMLRAMSPGIALPPSRRGRPAAPPRSAAAIAADAERTSAAGSAGTVYPSRRSRGAWPPGSAKPAAKVVSQPRMCVAELADIQFGARRRVMQLLAADAADHGFEVG